jgi:hypothetical protein
VLSGAWRCNLCMVLCCDKITEVEAAVALCYFEQSDAIVKVQYSMRKLRLRSPPLMYLHLCAMVVLPRTPACV